MYNKCVRFSKHKIYCSGRLEWWQFFIIYCHSMTKLKKVATKELPSHAQAAVLGLAAYAAMFAGVMAATSLGVILA